jgi:hypothetical protein
MVSYNVRGQGHDAIVFLNDIAVLPPAMVSGINIWTVSGSKFTGTLDVNGGSSGMSVDGPITTTATITASHSGSNFAPLNWLTIQVSGQSVKVPFFAV